MWPNYKLIRWRIGGSDDVGGWHDASGAYDPASNPSLGPGSPEYARDEDLGAPVNAAQNLFDPHQWAGTPLDNRYLEKQVFAQQESERSLEAGGGAWALRDASQGGAITAYAQPIGQGRLAYYDP